MDRVAVERAVKGQEVGRKLTTAELLAVARALPSVNQLVLRFGIGRGLAESLIARIEQEQAR